MKLKFNTDIQTLAINHILVIVIFALIYYYHYNTNSKEHFTLSSGEEMSLIDIPYFTLTTHTTIGYGDILPKSKQMKFCVILHQIAMLLLGIQIVYCFTCE